MSDADYRRWICDACGYIYDEAQGDPDSGLMAGTRYEDIPDDWQCPLCGLRKSDLRLLPEMPAPPVHVDRARKTKGTDSKSRGSAEHIVIVGAGVAVTLERPVIHLTSGFVELPRAPVCVGDVDRRVDLGQAGRLFLR